MVTDYIVTHEKWQPGDFLSFRQIHWQNAGNGAMPDVKDATGTVSAYINWGRWVVECPVGHGDAVIVSETFPYFICCVGGSRENGGNWYQVTFPADKARIETELLKRVAAHPLKDARYRNWKGETLKAIRDESRAKPELLKPSVVIED